VATTALEYAATDSEILEKMCPGLGEFAETIYSGFGTVFTKFMVYTANENVFPLHRGGMLHQNLFRVSISLSKCMPDFAMCYENAKNVFEIARGFLTAVIMDMHALQAGWRFIADGESSSTALYHSPPTPIWATEVGCPAPPLFGRLQGCFECVFGF
jgi:hypothetical protein